MKKVFLFLTMLLFAFTGVTRANVQQNRADQVIEQGFEDGLGDWTMNHCHSSSGPTSSYGGNTGNYAFRFYYTTNYPQYLISPELDDNDGVNFTFYAARYSSSYPETFKVGYSSTTNDPTEFTWGSEVTCTTMYGAGAYEEYSYDFPAGTKYVSIACTSNDQFYMFVDDITVTATEPAPAPTPGEIVEVTIGDPTSTAVNSYIPGYTLYDYAISQQIYTADEIGVAGTIETLTMWLKNNSSYARNINVYMTEVEATEFANNTDWVSMSADDMVASFTIENAYNAPIEFAIPLSTPFEYSGTGNLVICFQDVTGQWSSGLGGVEMDAAGNQAIYAYRDGTVYDPSNVGVNGTLLAKKNVIRLSIMTGGGEPSTFATVPAVLDLGYRPNGAWMAPYVFNLKSNVGAVTVNALDFSGNYFTYNAELPATISGNNPLEVAVSTGTAEAGEVNSTITVLYSGNNRDAEQLEITAIAYDPAEGDVYEMAVEVPALEPQETYTTEFPADMYKNYELPFETEANDAVYQLTFDQDVLLYAGAEDGNVVLYNSDFNGEAGPMVDNNYVYNGPEINPGPTALWFSYPYTGTNTWYGTSAGGGFYFGYKISADFIAANGLAGLTITTVEAAAREAYPYHCVIIEGGADPFDGNQIGGGSIENPEPLYFFDINLNMPAYISGNSDIWVIFYSDSPYAAYCGRYPADVNNGKIWTYNPNASAPAWTSNVNYTPVIYCRMLELPTGREVSMDLAKMEVKKGNGVESEIAEVEGNVMNVAKANMRNRDMQTLIEEGFEGGSMPTGWTQTGDVNSVWYVGSGDYSASTGSATGTYNALITHGTTGSVQYLVTPEMDLSNATSATVSCNYVNRSWAGDYDGFAICYRVNGGAWNELFVEPSYHSVWNNSGNIELTGLAANYQIGFRFTDNYGYGVGVDDVVVTADITSGGGGDDPWAPSFEAQIDGMFVPAGTYYLVAAADENAEVNIAIDEVPAPEQAVVIAPLDAEYDVEAPYLAEWILGDYTVEMQVLLGTQYPPQTVFIDWTDYLVQSAFITDLEPNQSYFFQVNERNAAGVVTEGEIIAFTTPIDPVEGFTVETAELYPGDAAVFTWEANARTLKGYNLYMDGVKVNETPIVGTEYAVEGLEYNMEGYAFTLKAVYDAGESAETEPIYVQMTGVGTVSGYVYDLDEEHPIANIPVTFIVLDEYQNIQNYEYMADETGFYTGEVLAGMSIICISEANGAVYGYAPEVYRDTVTGAPYLMVEYDNAYENINVFTHEYYYPVGMVTATEEENDVLVEWSWDPAELIVDFETGDFSQADFTLPAEYPWTVTTTKPHEGTYCMKSTCEGVASASSSIEATVEVPYEAKMGFWVRVSTETNYDKFHFYIDGVEMGSALSGEAAYVYKEYSVTEGTHTYKWEYTKDSSVNSNDDCVYVDDITMYRKDEPVPPTPGATTYTFDGSTTEGWTSLDANNDGYGWVLGSEIGGIYLVSGASLAGSGHNESQDMMCSGSYSNATSSAITPDNYLVAPAQITVQSGASISFYACAQDATYAAEHFGVAVSTTTATASAFTMVQEWTMTAKGAGTQDNNGKIRGSRAQGSWYEYNVDLSAYAGQTIWVAIRHFNCNDQFILNVDDITVYDGSQAMAGMTRNDRTFQSFNVYRRNLVDELIPEDELVPIATGVNEFEYTDETSLEFGEWQWGIAATYEGHAIEEERNRETATFGFEGGLEGWTGIIVNADGGEWIHSDDNLGGYDYTELAHTGTGFAMCYSYVDYDGAYDTDAFLVSPQAYTMDANSEINFFADNANDEYPENFSVWVSTAANPTSASDFTQVWSGGAKGTGSNGAVVRKANNRYENWREHTIDLSAYAGQTVWIAFRDVNYDMYEIWIDDVTITHAGDAPVPPTPGPTGNGVSQIVWSNVIEMNMEATITFYVTLNNGQSADGATIAIVGENNSYSATIEDGTAEVEVRKADTYEISLDLAGYTSEAGNEEHTWVAEWYANEDTKEYDILLLENIAPVEDLYVSPTGWAMWEGGTTGGVTPTPPTPPTTGDWYYYDNGINEDAIGTGGGNFWWAVMFPAGSYEGNAVTKVSTYDYMAMTGNVTIYNDGATAPATAVGTADVTLTGSEEFVEVEFATPVTIDPSKNLWIVYYNGSGATYPASVCANTGDANGRWVSLDGTSWEDMAIYSLDYTFMIRAYVATANKGEVVEISAPQGNGSNGTLANAGVAKRGDRTALYYKVKLDGKYVGETEYPFFQIDVEGMEEGEQHVTEVAPLYATGMGEWMTYTWTYAPCDNFDGMQAYTGEGGIHTATLNWTYPAGGPTPPSGNTTFTEGFEGGLNGWNVIKIKADGGEWLHSSQNLGGYDYTTLAHSGTGFAMCYSYVDYDGAYDTDSYMYTPEMYSIVNGSTLHFFADNANDSYPENFSVCVSTAANPTTAADFTQVWAGGAKGTGNGAAVRHMDGRYENWREHTIDLSAYAGQNVWIAFHDVNYDMYEIWIDDVELTVPAKMERSNRNMWDLVYEFDGTSGYQYGVATDGNFIYTSSWSSSSSSMFYKYDMQGNFIEEFNISGCGQLRGMTFDGDYFYGVANAATVYCVDLANHTLVSTFTTSYGAMRCITYDPERDGFWVVGNWSGNLTLISRTGSIVQTAGEPTSASDVAYYKDPDGVEHVYYMKNESGNGEVYEYNITTGTMGTSPLFNCANNPVWTGSSGGCFVGTYAEKTCFFADAQQSPQHIAIYELDSDTPGPGPTPVGDIVGAILYRNGEFVGMFDVNTTSFTDVFTEEEVGEYEYTIRVIYGGEPNETYYAMSCPESVTVSVLPDAIIENSVVNAIYPNPTKDNLYIEAEALTKVTIYNAMGQMVLDQEVSGNETVISMAQFESGVYMVMVTTEAGSSVKRISVIK